MNWLIGSLVITFCALSAIPAFAAAADDAAKACAGDPNPDKRIAACGKFLATNPKQDAKIAWVFNARGTAYFSKGELDKAVKDYDIAIRLDPKDSAALANRGTIHMAQGQPDLALADYNGALRINPKNANAYNLRGLLYSRTGQIDQAIQDYTSALKINPKFADAHNDRGYAYYSRGRRNSRLGTAKPQCSYPGCGKWTAQVPSSASATITPKPRRCRSDGRLGFVHRTHALSAQNA